MSTLYVVESLSGAFEPWVEESYHLTWHGAREAIRKHLWEVELPIESSGRFVPTDAFHNMERLYSHEYDYLTAFLHPSWDGSSFSIRNADGEKVAEWRIAKRELGE